MRTLIIYGTTYGFAGQCAKTLGSKLVGTVDWVNIQKEQVPDLAQYGKIIIGGSVYMGQIQKKIKEFGKNHLERLLTKKIGLFICCGFPEKKDEFFQNAFPKALLEHAVVKECFGGAMNIEKMNFAHRLIAKMATKAAAQEGKQGAVALLENIDKLAAVMNG